MTRKLYDNQGTPDDDDRQYYDIRPWEELDPMLAQVCAGIPNATVLEFGCYNGALTSKFLKWMPTPPQAYYLFEPDPRNIPRIRARAGIQQHTELIEAAVAAEDGTQLLYLSESTHEDHKGEAWTMSSSLKQPTENMDKKYPWLQYKEAVEVPTRSIDSFCVEKGLTYIDFIWADIEGGEDGLIAGAQKMLPHTRWLYLEYDPLHLYEGGLDLTQLLAVLPGWEIYKAFPVDVLFRNTQWTSPS